MAFTDNNRASHPQPESDPGTTKLLDGHKGPPGQKCPPGWHVKIKRKRIKIKGWIWKQLHRINAWAGMGPCRVHCGRSPPLLSAKMCSDKAGWALEGVERNVSLDGSLRDVVLLLLVDSSRSEEVTLIV